MTILRAAAALSASPLLILVIAAAVIVAAASVLGSAVRNARWKRWVEAAMQTPQRYSAGTLQSVQDYAKEVTAYGGISQKEAEALGSTFYRDLMQARQLKSLSNVRVGMTKDCYAEWDAVIQADCNARRTHMERPVTDPIVRVAGWMPYDGNPRRDVFERFDPTPTVHDRAIVLQILVRAREYEIDDASSKIVSGSGRQEVFLMYECVLIHHDRTLLYSDTRPPAGDERYEWDVNLFRRMNPQISDHRFVR